jgi:hypothetical protein
MHLNLYTGLFHKFILQSASALCDWSIEKSPLEYAMKVADGKHKIYIIYYIYYYLYKSYVYNCHVYQTSE